MPAQVQRIFVGLLDIGINLLDLKGKSKGSSDLRWKRIWRLW